MHSGQRLHDPSRDRPTNDAGDRNRGHEGRGHARTPVCGKPESEIENDAGEEPRFTDAQQKSHDVKLHRRLDEHERRRDHAPDHQNACDPDARAHSVENQIAGNLEKEIADEKHPRAKAVYRFAEAQVRRHLQLRITHIHAIEESDHIQHEHKRNNAPGNLAVSAVFELRIRRGESRHSEAPPRFELFLISANTWLRSPMQRNGTRGNPCVSNSLSPWITLTLHPGYQRFVGITWDCACQCRGTEPDSLAR